MSARDWQPDDEALLRVKVEYALGSEMQLTLRGADADGSVIVPTADLLPVSQPDDDTIERAKNAVMSAIRCYMPFGWEEGEPDGFASSIVDALSISGLFASPVREPGHSEAETGWFEFIMPGGSTTHIAYVYEDGSVYLPEGRDVVDEDDWVLAKASGRVWQLIRADQVADTTTTEGGE